MRLRDPSGKEPLGEQLEVTRATSYIDEAGLRNTLSGVERDTLNRALSLQGAIRAAPRLIADNARGIVTGTAQLAERISLEVRYWGAGIAIAWAKWEEQYPEILEYVHVIIHHLAEILGDRLRDPSSGPFPGL